MEGRPPEDQESADGDGAGRDTRGPDERDTGGPKRRGRKKRPLWRELAVIVCAALVLTLLLKAFVVEVFSIPSGSMENTLLVGDRVLVNKLVYHFRGIRRGDIVVFSGQGSWGPAAPVPGNPAARLWDGILNGLGLDSGGTDYVKRVIGVPGDRVACCDAMGRVTVNGVPLDERSYLYPGDSPSETPFSVTVPPGRLWVMGDHRSDSEDSRYRSGDPGDGTIPESAVVGRAFVIIWPPSRIGDLTIPATFQQAALRATALPLVGMTALPLLIRHNVPCHHVAETPGRMRAAGAGPNAPAAPLGGAKCASGPAAIVSPAVTRLATSPGAAPRGASPGCRSRQRSQPLIWRDSFANARRFAARTAPGQGWRSCFRKMALGSTR
ncbi:MAG: signal peptidase I [Streptosporangiaceae bacterium]|nr:signal peptidase I [Streptosporangiaceae bacterium]MBV9856026.1 signal peptidase I [Streptosporangiaceae bacterium]